MKKVIKLLMVSFMFLAFMTPVSANEDLESDFDLTGIDAIIEDAIANKLYPGASILVKLGDDVLYEKSFGHSYLYDMGTLLENPIVAQNDTIYDLASVTKVTATTQAAMMLVYQGKLDLDTPIVNYWPEFGTHGKEAITMRDLLTHTSGLPQWVPSFLYVSTRSDERTYIENMELLWEVGSTYKYSDFGLMSAAFTIESIVGMPIDTYLQENLYGPLGMTDTMFTPNKYGVDANRIAATSWGNPYEWRMSNEAEFPGYGYDTSKDAEAFLAFNGWREYTLVGEVNDGNAGMANEGVAGHAGLFSTTNDLSILGDVLLNGGTLNGMTFYDQAVIDEFTSADSLRSGRGLGWQIGGGSETSGYVGRYASSSVFSHAGFTGTQYILDADYDLQVIFLTNKQNIGHTNGNYKSPYASSRNIMNLVYEEIFAQEVQLRDSINQQLSTFEALDTTNYDLAGVEAVQAFASTLTPEALAEMTYQDLETANSDLATLISQLHLLDYSTLNALLAEAKAVDSKLYTDQTVKALTETVADIEAKMGAFVYQSEIDQARTTLQESIDGLVLIKNEEKPKDEDKEEAKPDDKKGNLPATGMNSNNIALYSVGFVLGGLVLIGVSRKLKKHS